MAQEVVDCAAACELSPPVELLPFSFADNIENEYRFNGLSASELSVLFDVELDTYVAFPSAMVQRRKEPKDS